MHESDRDLDGDEPVPERQDDWNVRPSYTRSRTGSAYPRGRSRFDAGPLVLILPLLSMVLAVLWITRWRPTSTGEFAPPPNPESQERVAGWMGRAAMGEGLELIVRLAPLHADARRQEFERNALAQRFKLGMGEPLRLELSYQRRAGAAAGRGLDLGGISVRDAEGLAADAPFATEDELQPGPNQVVDPVDLLFSIPSSDLRSGQEISLVLWGRPPGSDAQLRGLLPQPLRLEQHDLDRGRMEASLARLDGESGAIK